MFRLCSRYSAAALSVVLMGSVLLLAGCADSGGGATANAPKYKPVEKAESAPQPVPVAPSNLVDSTASLQPEAAVKALPPASDPPAVAPAKSAVGEPAAPVGKSDKPTAADIAQLVEALQELREAQPEGRTQQEQISNFIQKQQEIIGVGGVILESGTKTEDRLLAADSIMAAYQVLNQVGMQGMNGRMKSLAQSLATEKDVKLADFGKRVLFQVTVVGLMEDVGGPDAQGIVREIGKVLDETTRDEQTFMIVHNACSLLLKAGKQDEAVAAFKFVAEKIEHDKTPAAQEMASAARLQAQIIELKALSAVESLYEQKPGAEEQVLTAFRTLLTQKNPSPLLQQPASQAVNIAFMRGKMELVKQLYDLLDAAFREHPNQKEVEALLKDVDNGRKQLALISQPFEVQAVQLDGKPFDLAAYKGKVVLVDFWATWCGPCLGEIPRMKRLLELTKDKGFDIVGLSMDEQKSAVQQFFDRFQMPWATFLAPEIAAGKSVENWGEISLAKQFGIQAIPFFVLIGADGKIDSIYRGGGATETVAVRLKDLLKLDAVPSLEEDSAVPPGPIKPPVESSPAPAVEPVKPEAPAKPASEKPAVEAKPEADKPAEKPSSPEAPKSAWRMNPAALALPLGGLTTMLFAPSDAAAPAEAAAEAETNPYLAKPGLSTAQLVDFVLRMLDKPKSIQNRPGFTDAIVDACNRVLAAEPPAKEIDQIVVIESRFDILHRRACLGDEAADKLLVQFTEALQADARPRVARQVRFFQRERKTLNAETAPVEKIPELLKDLADYYGSEKLTARHLRMASATVALINRLENGDAREEKFAEFGALFTKSTDKQLSRYGKKLAKKPAGGESDLVGKPLELVGNTAKGLQFNWEAYRGKVVLVDFWATWCGPCRREMPHVKELYEKHREKGFDVVGVSLDKDLEALAAYLEENAIAWETLSGEETDGLAEKYGVRGIPTMMLVDREGKVVAVAHNIAALTPQLEKLLAAAK
jgi:thiol-disulfide isomerase/thioredoxin